MEQEGLAKESTTLVADDEITAVDTMEEEMVVDNDDVVTTNEVADDREVECGRMMGPDKRHEKKSWKRRPISERLLVSLIQLSSMSRVRTKHSRSMTGP